MKLNHEKHFSYELDIIYFHDLRILSKKEKQVSQISVCRSQKDPFYEFHKIWFLSTHCEN